MVAKKLDLYYRYTMPYDPGNQNEQKIVELVESEQESDNPHAEYQGGQNEER